MELEKPLTSRLIYFALAIGLLGANLYFINQIFQSSDDNNAIEEMADSPIFKYGFDIDAYHVMESRIQENQFFSDLLQEQGVPYSKIHNLVQTVSQEFDMRQLVVGKKCAFVADDLCEAPEYFIYEPNRYGYYVFDIESSCVERIDRPITKEVVVSSGIIEGSLWTSMESSGSPWALIERMENALAWTLDFYSIQNGDEYKLIYEKEFIDGNPVGVGELLGAYYKNYGNEFYAVYFENDKYRGFYDLEGRPTKRAFLKSPVRYSRVSSGYSKRRFHPVLKRYKSHLGTDYAAPHGAPIYAVANGVVKKVSRSRGNGKYVKIKHDKTYQTQYLHMSRYAKGIRSGVHVKQGQVIGYVGQTGLATGPHVCFRFWKNGRQVDHRRLNFPPSDPMPDSDMPAFECEKDFIVDILKNIEIKRDSQKIVELSH